jgi:hypothetical protein
LSETPKQRKEPASKNATSSRQDQLVRALWLQFRDTLLEDVSVFDQVSAALRTGSLPDDLRQRAADLAHKFVGSFTLLKLPEGAGTVSRMEERLLSRASDLTADELAAGADTMRRLLKQGPPETGE